MLPRRTALLLPVLVLVVGLGSGCATSAPAPTATSSVAPTRRPATATPAPSDRYQGLPTGADADGFPTLGAANTPVTLTVYGSYDSPASRQAHTDLMPRLVPRVRAGQVRVLHIPLSGTGPVGNGQGAARAALCASTQEAFWPYHDGLYALQATYGQEAFTPARLASLADALALDRATWDACLLSATPDATLAAAAARATTDEQYAGTPTLLVNGAFVLSDMVSLDVLLDDIAAQGVDAAGAVAALPTPSAPTETPEPTTEIITLSPLAGERIVPPLELSLPTGWGYAYETLVMQDVDMIRTMPFAVYQGPVSGGTGTIVVLWGFPNITTGNPFAAEMGLATPTPDLWIDGLRLLRLAVVEQTCNIGTDLQRSDTVGGIPGTGTQFSAVDCADLPDTRGWFVGVQQYGLNYVFYAYTDPIEAATGAAAQLRAVLDGVRFLPLPTPAPTTPAP